MAVLSRDAILAANDRVTEEVEVPEWGKNGKVLVRSLTAAEQKEVAQTLDQTNLSEIARGAKARMKLIVYGCIGSDGNQLFTGDDYDALEEKNPGVLNRIVEAVQRMSGIGVDAQDAAEGKATSG